MLNQSIDDSVTRINYLTQTINTLTDEKNKATGNSRISNNNSTHAQKILQAKINALTRDKRALLDSLTRQYEGVSIANARSTNTLHDSNIIINKQHRDAIHNNYKINKLNAEIMTKRRQIQIDENASTRTENTITLLKVTFTFILISIITISLARTGILSQNIMTILLIITVIVFSLIYIKLYINMSNRHTIHWDLKNWNYAIGTNGIGGNDKLADLTKSSNFITYTNDKLYPTQEDTHESNEIDALSEKMKTLKSRLNELQDQRNVQHSLISKRQQIINDMAGLQQKITQSRSQYDSVNNQVLSANDKLSQIKSKYAIDSKL